MAVGILRRWAASAPVPVFVARGGGAGWRPVELAADLRVRLVPSPRHASVLLAAGRFPGPMGEALNRVHDQLPAPRATVWWTADADAGRPAALGDAAVVTGPDPVDHIVAAHRALLLGHAPSTPDVGANVPPNEFVGRGENGHGGEGMMGGVPYGRPMAMTAEDRDGLALDRLPVALGPFLPGFTNGLQATVALQGGIVQELSLHVLELGEGRSLDDLAGEAPTPWRSRRRWLSEAMRVGGLEALAVRTAQAVRQEDEATSVVRLVRRSGLLRSWSGIGALDGIDAASRLAGALDSSGPSPAGPADVPLDRLAASLVGSDWGDVVVAVCSFGFVSGEGAHPRGVQR